MSKSLLPFALVSLTFSCAVGPSEPVHDGGREASASQPIIYGDPSTADQDSVVLIEHRVEGADTVGLCSGTIVAPNLILTARHCVSNTRDGGIYCDDKGNGTGGGAVVSDRQPGDLYVFTGRKRPGPDTKPAGQGKRLFHDNAKHTCNHDLALIQLKAPIAGAKVASIRLDSRARKGETMTAVGWGVTVETDHPDVRQQRTGIPIRRVGPFAGDATDPRVAPNEFRVGESFCSGDSGGPSFSEETGAVIGVVARGGNGTYDPNNVALGCVGDDARNDYVETSPFKSVILAAFQAAGHKPKVEPPRSEPPIEEPPVEEPPVDHQWPEDPPKEEDSLNGDPWKDGCSIGPAGSSSPAFGAVFLALGVIAIGLRRGARK